MLKIRKLKGFTLIELLVVVVIIGILAAIALPNFIGAQKKAKVSSVKANMHTSQLSSESYATDAGGAYGAASSDIQPYYPGGGNSVGGTPGTFPTNPMTGTQNEVPAACALSDTTSILNARKSTAASNLGGQANPGQTTYLGITDANNAAIKSSYSITGGDDQKNDVLGNLGKMVLSNQ